jgi:hypothetical protein
MKLKTKSLKAKLRAAASKVRPDPIPEAAPTLTPSTAYQGGKGWPSDRPIDGIISAYKSFARLLATTADDGQHRKWLELEVAAHTMTLKMQGVDVADLDIHEGEPA